VTKTLLLRARLKQRASIASIASLLLPEEPSARAGAAHQLVWSLFANNPTKQRNFLWHEDSAGTFFILANEPPLESEIFDIDVRSFAPNLSTGDRLEFSLRANATRTYKIPSDVRSRRTDIVMANLYAISKTERASGRSRVIAEAGTAWLTAQGTNHGFWLPRMPSVDGYHAVQIPRKEGKRIKISILDFSGVLEVSDPEKFRAALLRGFGRAKAFGCGLMLIRRAHNGADPR
jgi:CRISPR system Cascade subunit CasE